MADERRLLRAFLALLGDEESALVAGDYPRIESVAREKAQCLQALQACPAASPADPEIAELRERSRRANARNGGLIAMRSARLDQRARVLGARNDGPTYGADGRMRASPFGGAGFAGLA